MKIILEVDFSTTMNTANDPPQRDWGEGDYEKAFLEELEEKIEELRCGITGAEIDVKDENGKTLI